MPASGVGRVHSIDGPQKAGPGQTAAVPKQPFCFLPCLPPNTAGHGGWKGQGPATGRATVPAEGRGHGSWSQGACSAWEMDACWLGSACRRPGVSPTPWPVASAPGVGWGFPSWAGSHGFSHRVCDGAGFRNKQRPREVSGLAGAL